MSVTYRVTTALTIGGVQPFSTSVDIAAGSDARLNETMSVGANTVTFSSDVSQLKVIAIESTQNATLVLRSSSTPTQTLTLTSEIPFLWYYGSGVTNPLTDDFTNLIATVGTAGTLEAYKLEDPTV